MGGYANDEIPLLVMLFYLFRNVESSSNTGSRVEAVFTRRSTRKTSSGGEFGWGGTSVKR